MVGWRIDLRPFFTEEYTIQQRSRCPKVFLGCYWWYFPNILQLITHITWIHIYIYIYIGMLFLIYPGFSTFLPGNCKKPRNEGVSPNLRMVPVIMRFLSFPSSRLVGFWRIHADLFWESPKRGSWLDAEFSEAWKTRLVYIYYIYIYIYITYVYIYYICIYIYYICIYIYYICIYYIYVYYIYIIYIIILCILYIWCIYILYII